MTTRSPHGPLAIPCENCHTAAGWRPIRAVPEFDHNKTRYPLREMHEKVQCTQCHFKPVFTDVGKNCEECHADIHQRKMGTNCAQCHTVRGWKIAVQRVKDHQNRFPLFGAHAAVQCEDCHKGAAVGQFLGLSTACASCHLRDYQKTTNPNHVSAKFATTCDSCHSFDSWLGAKFDHSATGFPLTNGHANVPCASCHLNNNYSLMIGPTDCGNSGCHLTTWQQTNNPVHSSAGAAFAVANCNGCHNTISWTTAIFDHSTTGFLLTNGHANVACAACHLNNNYNLTMGPTDCGNSGCHLTTWKQTNNPMHSTSGPAFQPTNCATCHTTKGWDSASFDHSTTGWALTGSHQLAPAGKVVACTDSFCHVGNNYKLPAEDCSVCHQAAWLSTQTLGGQVPDHIKSGFPASQCSMCHDTLLWADGKFNHSTTGWPLQGAHVTTPCSSCHMGANPFGLTSATTDCYGCHQAAWLSTQTLSGAVPNHVAALYPTTCLTCHTTWVTTGWLGATFNHTWFRIPHNGSVCSDCHLVSTDYAKFSCIDCHTRANAHNKGSTDQNHQGVGGYVYGATTCYDCHKN